MLPNARSMGLISGKGTKILCRVVKKKKLKKKKERKKLDKTLPPVFLVDLRTCNTTK